MSRAKQLIAHADELAVIAGMIPQDEGWRRLKDAETRARAVAETLEADEAKEKEDFEVLTQSCTSANAAADAAIAAREAAIAELAAVRQELAETNASKLALFNEAFELRQKVAALEAKAAA